MNEHTPALRDTDSFEQSLESIERLANEISELTNSTDTSDTGDEREIAEAMAALDRARPPQPSPHRPRSTQHYGARRSRTRDSHETAAPPPAREEVTHELPRVRDDPPPRVCSTIPLPSGARTPKLLRFFYPESPQQRSEYRTSVPQPDRDEEDEGPVFLEPLTETTQEVRELRRESRYRFALITGVILCVVAIPTAALSVWQPWSSETPTNTSTEWSEEHGGTQYDPYVDSDTSSTHSEERTDSQDTQAPVPSEEAPSDPATQNTDNSPPPDSSVPPGTAPRSGAADPLHVTLRASDISPRVGEQVHLSVVWSDGVGQLAGVRHDWGDGSPAAGSSNTPECTTNKHDTQGQKPLTHTFTQPGTFTTTVSVTTYTCDGRQETQEVTMVFRVSDATQEPTPSPTQSQESSSATPPPRE